MPDCIFIYDGYGVGCIEHSALLVAAKKERFIETGVVPSDARIVRYAWKYSNIDGGPDRRFKNNQKIPVCVYGNLDLKTHQGLLFHLQTSNHEAPMNFIAKYNQYLCASVTDAKY